MRKVNNNLIMNQSPEQDWLKRLINIQYNIILNPRDSADLGTELSIQGGELLTACPGSIGITVRIGSKFAPAGTLGLQQTVFGHHLDRVSEAEFEAKVPPHAQYEDLAIEVATFKQFKIESVLPSANGDCGAGSIGSASTVGPRVAGPSMTPTGMNSRFSDAPDATAGALRADRLL